MHTLKVTFQAPEQPGPFHATLNIDTDIQDEPPAVLKMFATVAP